MRIEAVPLRDAKLCLDCDMIHNGTECPQCGASAHSGHLSLSKVLGGNLPKPRAEQRTCPTLIS